LKLILIILTACLLSCNTTKKVVVKQIVIPLDGSKSFDPDGWLAWVRWQQISGPASTIKNPDKLVTEATATTKGVRIYKLTGCDNMGAIRTDTTIKR